MLTVYPKKTTILPILTSLFPFNFISLSSISFYFYHYFFLLSVSKFYISLEVILLRTVKLLKLTKIFLFFFCLYYIVSFLVSFCLYFLIYLFLYKCRVVTWPKVDFFLKANIVNFTLSLSYSHFIISHSLYR